MNANYKMKLKTGLLLSAASVLLNACGSSNGSEIETSETPSQIVSVVETDSQASQFKSVENWGRAGNVTLNGDNVLVAQDTTENSVLINSADWADTPFLVTNNYYRDSVVTFDFMLAKGSSAALYLQSRYEINISDNFEQHELNSIDMGGLGMRREGGGEEENFHGLAPSANATLAPGVWQTMEVTFRAPRFSETGDKTERALFLEVKVNGELVQSNTIASAVSKGSTFVWEQNAGQTTIQANRGQIAIRNFDARRADFGDLVVPKTSGQANNFIELTDYVKLGGETFHDYGCAECHATVKGDEAVKSGPNLFGLFTLYPRDRTIVEGEEERRFTVKADHSYLTRSLRDPESQLAVAEWGAKKGEAYLPVMPAFRENIFTDKDVDAIGAYLLSLNDLEAQGPVVKLVKSSGTQQYVPMEDRLLFLVDDKTRLQRGPMGGVSGRSIHVGFPGGLNYSFDPRILGIAKIWQGGYLDMSGELRNRGGGGLKPGYNSQEINLEVNDENSYLMVPLNTKGDMLDFSFKEAKRGDSETMLASLNSPQDHLTRLKNMDAQFLGYDFKSSGNAPSVPSFNYRVGQNILSTNTNITTTGATTITVSGVFQQAQSFALNPNAFTNAEVSVGAVKDNIWRIPAKSGTAVLTAKMGVSEKPWSAEPSSFKHEKQKLIIKTASAEMPDGYAIESFMPPKDNYGRDQLFEALGLAVAKDGTIVLSTRTAGIWRIVDGEWSQFAEGTFDSLGLVINDDKGLVLTVGQKAELTRISDTDGDGKADTYKTLFDAFSYHSNYHTYMHGPVQADDGRYFISLNLAHNNFAYKAGGHVMGSLGGYSGWGFMIDDKGDYEPWVNGFRSPAGLGKAPDGTIWYTENQGDFVGTSKVFEIKKDSFYGHPSGLVDVPGMVPTSPEITWDAVKESRAEPIILLPHNLLANSPGHISWDTTGGKFGKFAGQMIVGDQAQSNMFRMLNHSDDDKKQGVAIPFMSGMESGIMRPVFLKDGSLLVGQTGRGWQAKGGNIAALQRIVWDGHTIPSEIANVTATQDGFEIALSKPMTAGVNAQDHLTISSWVYRDAPDYGSPEMDQKDEALTAVSLSDDRKTINVRLENTDQPTIHPDQTARVYHIKLNRKAVFGDTSKRSLDAYYTLYAFE